MNGLEQQVCNCFSKDIGLLCDRILMIQKQIQVTKTKTNVTLKK